MHFEDHSRTALSRCSADARLLLGRTTAPMDDLATWLRAAAENKINTKNTWRATLIDHFTDLRQFQDPTGINFQKAGAALDGCIKVYTTRVDDVAASTTKLLSVFNSDTKQRKRPGRKRSCFIEKRLANINICADPTPGFYDPVFSAVLNRPDILFLLDELEQTAAGLFAYAHPASRLSFEQDKADLACRDLPILPSLTPVAAEYDDIASTHTDMGTDADACAGTVADAVAAEMDGASSPQEEWDGAGDELADDVSGGEEDLAEAAAPAPLPVVQETPFGYFAVAPPSAAAVAAPRGWAGPALWRVSGNSAPRSKAAAQPRTAPRIAFVGATLSPSLLTKGDTTLTREQILERRSTRHLLPDDLAYRRDDLFKFFIHSGFFQQPHVSGAEVLKGPEITCGRPADELHGTASQIITDNVGVIADGNAFCDHNLGAFEGAEMDVAGNETLLNATAELTAEQPAAAATPTENGTLTHIRPPEPFRKHVDIKWLKTTLATLIPNGVRTLSALYSATLAAATPADAEAITPQICFVALLYLANENNLILSSSRTDISIG